MKMGVLTGNQVKILDGCATVIGEFIQKPLDYSGKVGKKL